MDTSKERHAIVCAAYLFLVKDSRVLLLRRFNTGYEDGNYSVPAGHVDQGESVSDCLLREVHEEIGVDISKEDVELAHVMHRKETEKNDERLDLFFICRKWGGKIKNMEPHKCDKLEWFEIEKLPRNTIPYIRNAIENSILDKKLYSELHW